MTWPSQFGTLFHIFSVFSSLVSYSLGSQALILSEEMELQASLPLNFN